MVGDRVLNEQETVVIRSIKSENVVAGCKFVCSGSFGLLVAEVAWRLEGWRGHQSDLERCGPLRVLLAHFGLWNTDWF